MFKDYDKYLKTSLKVYLFVLVIVFIMKLVGLDYFGLDESNKALNSINLFFNKYKLTFIFYFINLSIYQYLMTSIMCNDSSSKFKKFTLITLPFTALLQYYKYLHINNPLIYILEFLYLFIICKIYNKKIKTKRIISTLIIIFILQLISNIVRGHNQLDRVYENYGRYMDGRERYGHNEDTKRSLQYMLESMEDFGRMLKEDAGSQEEVQMIRDTAQRIAQM